LEEEPTEGRDSLDATEAILASFRDFTFIDISFLPIMETDSK